MLQQLAARRQQTAVEGALGFAVLPKLCVLHRSAQCQQSRSRVFLVQTYVLDRNPNASHEADLLHDLIDIWTRFRFLLQHHS